VKNEKKTAFCVLENEKAAIQSAYNYGFWKCLNCFFN